MSSRPYNILQASIPAGDVTQAQLNEGIQEAKDYADALNHILFVEHTIMVAELVTIAATPKILIPAPGAGRYIKINRIIVKQLTLTVDHPVGQAGSFKIHWDNTAQTQVISIGSVRIGATYPNYWTYSFPEAGSIANIPSGSTVVADTLNKAVILKDAATTTLAGDNYMKIKLEYTIETY
jgi:hypothetical protein